MMQSEAALPTAEQSCLALFIATALAALLLTLSLFTPVGRSFALYAAVFLVTALVVAALGMPLYQLALRMRRANIWTAPAAGMIAGAALPLIIAVSDRSMYQWRYVAVYTTVGAIGGLAFYLTATARRAPRRNVSLLLALAAITIFVASLSAPAP